MLLYMHSNFARYPMSTEDFLSPSESDEFDEPDVFGRTEEELARLDAEDFKWKQEQEDKIGRRYK